MKPHRSLPIAAALLLGLAAGGAGATPDGLPEETIDRIRDRAARAEERIEAARQRAGTPAAERAEGGRDRAAVAIARRLDHVQMRAASQAQAAQERVLAYPDRLEMTDGGPAVRGQVVAIDPDPAVLTAARKAGFAVIAEEVIEGLGLRSVTLGTPRGVSVQRSLARLARLAPGTDFAANHLHRQSGVAADDGSSGPSTGAAALAQGTTSVAADRRAAPAGGAIGIIDGGVARHASLPGKVEQRGFSSGGPMPDAHATAVASLAVGHGSVRGAAPGAPLLVADIYGSDPAGGNALALVRALGWMAVRKVPVVVVSLVGPANRLVARAVAEAQARGILLVAPVGNGGPAAPPAYPASYPGVIAVTGVDGRNRALIEAGRSLHLDYAAPGADMAAANLTGGLAAVRGTSFAAPFVAGRLYHAVAAGGSPLSKLNEEAVDLGSPGPDRVHGRGLVCGMCRTSIPKKLRTPGLKDVRSR